MAYGRALLWGAGGGSDRVGLKENGRWIRRRRDRRGYGGEQPATIKDAPGDEKGGGSDDNQRDQGKRRLPYGSARMRPGCSAGAGIGP